MRASLNVDNSALTKRRRAIDVLTSPPMLLSLMTVIAWGLWGLQSKIIVDRISPWMNQILFPIGLLPLIFCVVFSKNLRRRSGSAKKGAVYALLNGILGATGNVAFFLALGRGGQAAIVVPLVGLAPLITVILAFALLRESLNRVQMIGLVLALVSIYLLSI